MELERYRQLAYGTALSLLSDHHLAEDAVQDAFLEAHRGWDTLRESGKRAAWVRSIVRNRCFRSLRRRDLGGAPLPELSTRDEPWQRVAESEERGGIVARVKALPRRLREVVVLHYLRGCPQREVAAFLELPVTTVNNRLHLARRLLKGGTTMMIDTPQAGTVVRSEPPVVDVRFDADAEPDVFDALALAGAEPVLRVAQPLGGGLVRCVLLSDDAPAVGQTVMNRTADGGTYFAAIASDEDLTRTVAALGAPRSGMRETGIKPLDLFTPLPEFGTVGLFGTAGTGKMVLTMELAQRLGGAGPRLFYLGHRSEPALIRDFAEEEAFDQSVVWLLTDRESDPEFAASGGLFDVSLYCTPLMGVRGLWPAIDPVHSRSAVEVGERHGRLAAAARELIIGARETWLDAALLELLACRAYGAARRRLAASPEPATSEGLRARLLEAFLTNPFDVAKDYNGIPGEVVPLAATLDGVEAILSGDCDARSPKELSFIGALPR